MHIFTAFIWIFFHPRWFSGGEAFHFKHEHRVGLIPQQTWQCGLTAAPCLSIQMASQLIECLFMAEIKQWLKVCWLCGSAMISSSGFQFLKMLSGIKCGPSLEMNPTWKCQALTVPLTTTWGESVPTDCACYLYLCTHPYNLWMWLANQCC